MIDTFNWAILFDFCENEKHFWVSMCLLSYRSIAQPCSKDDYMVSTNVGQNKCFVSDTLQNVKRLCCILMNALIG